jgi:hypothetical protein
VPFALRQHGAGETVTGAVPCVAACTEGVTQRRARTASVVGLRIAATHGCLGWGRIHSWRSCTYASAPYATLR